MREQDQDFDFLVESRLTAFGAYLTDFTETDEGFAITYESIAATQADAVPHREVGRIVNVFRDVTDEPVALEGTVTDMDGDPVGTWTVEREWLDRLEAGDLTEIEFSETVIEHIDPAESASE